MRCYFERRQRLGQSENIETSSGTPVKAMIVSLRIRFEMTIEASLSSTRVCDHDARKHCL